MNRFLLLFFPLILTTLPACSKDSATTLFNSGRYEELLRRPAGGGMTALQLYARARALYETDRYGEAAKAFRLVIKQVPVLKAIARYYLGKSLAQDGRKKAALQGLSPLLDDKSSAVYSRRALRIAAQNAKTIKDFSTLRKITGIALKRFPKSSFYLRLAHLTATELKDKSGARDLAWRMLARKPYGKDNTLALKTVRRHDIPYSNLSNPKKRLYAEALIRAGEYGKAIRLLGKPRPSKKNLEKGLNLAWALRLRRRYKEAIALLQALETHWKRQPSSWRRIQISRFRIALRRGRFARARALLRGITDNRRLFRTFAKRVRNNKSWRLRINTLAANLFPRDSFFQRELFALFVNGYNRGQYGRLPGLADRIRASLRRPELRSGLAFFLARVAYRRGHKKKAARYATRVIASDPFGYYHSQLRPALPGIRIPSETVSGLTNLSAICHKLLLGGKITAETKKLATTLWQKDPLKKNLTHNKPLNTYLTGGDRTLFDWFIAHKLYREAFYLLYSGLNDRGKRYHQLPLEALAPAARLAKRGGAYRSWFSATQQLLRKSGWGLEVLCLSKILPQSPRLLHIYPRPFRKETRKWSRKYKLEPDFVYALTRQESAFMHRVTSWAGARGLMQIMPLTGMNLAAGMKIRNLDLLDPETNIRLGTNFLRWLKKKYTHSAEILIGYNAGPGRISTWKRRYRQRFKRWDRWGFIETIPFQETRGYVKTVLSNLFAYRYTAMD